MNLIDDVRDRLDRVEGETRKAAIYLAMSRSWMRAPRAIHRWTHSNTGEALPFIRDGLHMAFVVTLEATYQRGKGRVTILSLMKKIDDTKVRQAIAEARGVPLEEVAAQADVAARTFSRIKALESYGALAAVRNAGVAHHTAAPDAHGATMGPLNRLMIRSVHLVDQIAVAVRGEPTTTTRWLRKLLHQGTAFWSAGMDAYLSEVPRSRRTPAPDDC
jgi:hypothetical protein